MKTLTFVLLLTGCLLMHCIAHACVSNESQQNSENSTALAQDNSGAANVKNATAANQGREDPNLAAPKRSGGAAGRTRIHSRSRISPINGSYAKPIAPSRAGAGATSSKQTPSANLPIGVHRTQAFLPKSGAAIGGQQFRNGRRGSATPTVIGGPAAARKNTMAISGTQLTQRH